MKRSLRKLGSEWEKTLFWCLILALMCLLGNSVLNRLRQDGGSSEPPKVSPPGHSLLGPQALAFLNPIEGITLEGGNPFAFIRRLSDFKENVERPWRSKSYETGKKGPPKGNNNDERPLTPVPQTAAVAAPVSVDTTPATVPETPTPPPPVRIVRYKGLHIGPSGTALAYVSTLDPDTKETTGGFIRSGTNTGGVTIDSFDEHSLHVVVPGSGKSVTVPLGGQKKIVLK